MKAFIDQASQFSRNPPKINLVDIRKAYLKASIRLRSNRPSTVKVKNWSISNSNNKINLRIYRACKSSDVQIIYLHGGGFIMGNLETDDDICRDICELSHIDVIAIDYRLSPENKFPAAYEDALICFENLIKIKPVILIGHSSGGTLAAMISQKTEKNFSGLLGQVLIYPYLGGNIKKGSYITHSNAPLLTTKEMQFFLSCWLVSKRDFSHFPLNQKSFKHLAPTIILTADLDPLRDDGIQYARRIKAEKGSCHHIVGKGLVHGFIRARHTSKKANKNFLEMITEIKKLEKSFLG